MFEARLDRRDDVRPGGGHRVAEAPSMLIEAKEITKSFEGLVALQAVSIGVEAGKIVGLIGPNGSGKSTLFDIITGFQRVDRGSILFDGKTITGLAPHQIARRGLIRTFQMSEGGQRLTAIENLLAAAADQDEQNFVTSLLGLRALLARERANLKRAREILHMVGLAALGDELVGSLSGGQKKLIDLGRVFMARPMLCLLDEPTAGVNPTLIHVILDSLRRMNRDFGISLLIVEHNMRVVRDLCDYVYVLDAGSLICEGTPEAVQSDERVLDIYLSRTRTAADR
jgi:neutral amino acid transport system ATP-binding protein